MGDKGHVKIEYVNTSTCDACLSSDRALFPLGHYKSLFNKICDNYPSPNPQICLCWECMALLKKVKIFSERVETAQKILNCHFFDKLTSIPQCLTTLSINLLDNKDIHVTHRPETKEVCEEKAEVVIEKKDDPPKATIKEELDDDHNQSDLDNYDDYVYLEDVKPEISDELLKIVDKNERNFKINDKQRRKKAEYTIMKLGYNADYTQLCKSVSITPEAVQTWREKELLNENYLKYTYRCVTCIESFRYDKGLVWHNKSCHHKRFSKGSAICEICSSTFKNPANLSRHMSKHFTIQECVSCGYQCYNIRNMKMHVMTHDLRVRCNLCGHTFRTVRDFHQHHTEFHTKFVCDNCGKTCKSRKSMEKHVRCHFEQKCAICFKTFKNRRNLRAHEMLKHTVKPNENSYCVICDIQFNNVATFKRHLQTGVAHRNERSNTILYKECACPICGKNYSRSSYMKNHYRYVHLKQSKYKCKECDLQFLNRTKYVCHLKYVHEGLKKEKNKMCSVCGRGFHTNRILLNHLRTHSGERPFECEFCNAKFTQKCALDSHVKYIHLKAKRRGCWQE